MEGDHPDNALGGNRKSCKIKSVIRAQSKQTDGVKTLREENGLKGEQHTRSLHYSLRTTTLQAPTWEMAHVLERGPVKQKSTAAAWGAWGKRAHPVDHERHW